MIELDTPGGLRGFDLARVVAFADVILMPVCNSAFDRAAADDDVSVIILAANGPHFSAGHDLRETDRIATMDSFPTVGTWCG